MYRVTLVTTNLARGGAEAQLVRLALGLRARGWDPKVLTMLKPEAHLAELLGAGVEVRSLMCGTGLLGVVRGVRGMTKHIEEHRPHLVTAFNFPADVLARISTLFLSEPVRLVSSLRTASLGSGARRLFYRLAGPLTSAMTANSLAGRAELLRIGMAPDRVKYIPNGIDPAIYRQVDERAAPALRRSLGGGDFVWLAIGNAEQAKDYPTLLRAVRNCLDAGTPICLWVAGAGRQLRETIALAGRLKVETHVNFLGRRDDVPTLLAAASALVMSSTREGLPNAVMEAMAAALPVVATRVGGIPELVLHEKTGLLVRPQDPGSLADAMLQVMRWPEETRLQMGLLGQRAVTAFGLETMIDRWQDLFLHLLTNETGRPPGEDQRASGGRRSLLNSRRTKPLERTDPLFGAGQRLSRRS